MDLTLGVRGRLAVFHGRLIALTFLLAGVCAPHPLGAQAKNLFYYLPAEDAWKSLVANAGKISILAPQVFVADLDGQVTGTVEEKVRQLAVERKIPLMPVLVNAGFRPEVAHRILGDPAARQRVISEALRLCQENGCNGLQLDFEGAALEDGPHYTELVRDAAQAFHGRGLQVSVAVVSGLFTPALPPENYDHWFGGFPFYPVPYQFKELARYVDFITLMTYDHYGKGTPPGPVAGYPWVEQSLRFVLQDVPARKLSLGVPFYGRRWCWQDTTDVSFAQVQDLLQTTKATVHRHPWQRTPSFEYEQGGCRNVVFFEDRQSLKEKIGLVRRFRLLGFSAWRLGQEDPSFWKEVPAVRRPAPAKR